MSLTVPKILQLRSI